MKTQTSNVWIWNNNHVQLRIVKVMLIILRMNVNLVQHASSYSKFHRIFKYAVLHKYKIVSYIHRIVSIVQCVKDIK